MVAVGSLCILVVMLGILMWGFRNFGSSTLTPPSAFAARRVSAIFCDVPISDPQAKRADAESGHCVSPAAQFSRNTRVNVASSFCGRSVTEREAAQLSRGTYEGAHKRKPRPGETGLSDGDECLRDYSSISRYIPRLVHFFFLIADPLEKRICWRPSGRPGLAKSFPLCSD
jgi:hypothetical protein